MDLYNLLSTEYEELKLRNVEISKIDQIFIEHKLIRERFFHNIVSANNLSITADKNAQDTSLDKIDVIYEQINMIFSAVNDFTASLGEVDLDLSKTSFIARFIARNIRILKRQLKSTYNQLPWEEIEFCLSCFAFLSTLERKNLQGHLTNFADKLKKVFKYSIDLNDNKIEEIKNKIKNCIDKGIPRNREKVPDFESLYSDYELIKDPYSLNKMLRYIKLALSVSPEEQSGRLVIERALQVIGEYLKDSPQSPHLSDSIEVTLIRMNMAVIIEIAPSLRNLLSHNNNFDRLFSRNSIEKEEGFFTKIQGDLRKIQGVITQIFYNAKIRHYRKWYEDIISNDDSKIVKELSDEFIKKINLEETELMDTKTHDTDVLKQIGDLVGEMKNIIKPLYTINLEEKDKNEKLFIRIEEIIASDKNKITYIRTNYNARLKFIKGVVRIIEQNANKDSDNYRQETKKRYQGILNMIRTEEPCATNLWEIKYLINQITNNIKGHNIYQQILSFATDIYEIIYSECIRTNEIVTFKEKLGTLEIDTSFQESRVESELNDVLRAFECEVKNDEKYKKLESALTNKKKIHTTKLKLIDHFEGKPTLTQEEYNRLVKGLDETEGKEGELLNYFNREKGKNLMKKLPDHYGNFLEEKKNCVKLLKSVVSKPYQETLLNIFDKEKLLYKDYTPESLVDGIINKSKGQLPDAEYNKLIKNLEGKKQAHKAKQELIDFFENNSNITAIEYKQLVHKLDTTPINERELNKLYSSSIKAILAVESLNDTYGAFIKAVAKKETTINEIYNSFSKLSESLQLEFNSQELLKKIFKEKRIQILEDYFSEKLSLLKKRLENVNCGSEQELILHYKNNETLQAEVEMLLLDLSDISSNIDRPPLRCLREEFLSLDGDFPFLMGVSLRNYLAHGDALIDSLPFDPLIAVISNALIFTKEGESIIALWNLGKDSEMKEYLTGKVNDNVVDKLSIEELPSKLQQYAKSIITLKRSHYWIDYLKSMLSDKGKCNRPIVMSDVASRYNKNLQLLYRKASFDALKQNPKQAHEVILNTVNEIDVRDPKMWTPLRIATQKRRKDGSTLLHAAVLNGYDQVVEVLLKNEAEVNAKDIDNFTPLHNAAFSGHQKMVEILLSHNAEINSEGTDGSIPLHFAAINGNTDVIKFLAKKGADVNAKNNAGYTPLHFAAAATHNKVEVVEHLIEKGAIIDSEDNEKRTPLHAAANVGNKVIVETLLNKEADVHSISKDKYTPLHMAAMSGHDQVVKVLLNKGAEVNVKCEDGRVPLHFAASSANSKTTEHLLKNSAKVDIKSNDGVIPLHLATNNLDVVESLIKKRESEISVLINTLDNYNRTPLHFAVKQNNLNVIRFLVENGADVTASDKCGCKPLHYWRGDQYSDVEIVGYLVDKGVDLNTPRSNGKTLLHLVAAAGYLSAAKYIVDKTAQVDIHDNKGMTPLHLAAFNGNSDVVEFLVKNGADINTPDNDECTSLHYAAKGGNEKVVKSLLNKRAKFDAKDKVDQAGLFKAAADNKVVTTFVEEEKNTNIVNVPNKYKQTPLHDAAYGGYNNIVKILLENEASLNIPDEDGMTPLHVAVYNGNLSVIKSLVDKGANVDALDNDKRTPLHKAIEQGHENVIKILLKNKANVNIADSKGNTPLHDAALNGHDQVVNVLLKEKADVNAKETNGFTPLHNAALCGHKKVVEILLSHNAEINSEGTDGSIPLHFAAFNGNMDVLILLAEQEGADVNAKNKDGKTPLNVAAAVTHTKAEIVEYLIGKGAIIDSKDNKNRTPLYYAASLGNKGIVEILLHKEADVRSISEDKYTPLHMAAMGGYDQVVEVLLNKKADVNAKDTRGFTPLHNAALHGHKNVVEILLRHDAEINSKERDGFIPLHFAASNGNMDVLILLAEQEGADVNDKNNYGKTPLYVAATHTKAEVVEYLLGKDAKVDIKINNGKTHLHLAALTGNLNVVEIFVKKGANVNAQDIHGYTPLHYAAGEDYVEITKVLLKNEANPNVASKTGYTPLHYAAQYGNLKIVQLLLANKADPNIVDENGKRALDLVKRKSVQDSETENLETITDLLSGVNNVNVTGESQSLVNKLIDN